MLREMEPLSYSAESVFSVDAIRVKDVSEENIGFVGYTS